LKLTTERHEASHGLAANAELLDATVSQSVGLHHQFQFHDHFAKKDDQNRCTESVRIFICRNSFSDVVDRNVSSHDQSSCLLAHQRFHDDALDKSTFYLLTARGSVRWTAALQCAWPAFG